VAAPVALAIRREERPMTRSRRHRMFAGKSIASNVIAFAVCRVDNASDNNAQTRRIKRIVFFLLFFLTSDNILMILHRAFPSTSETCKE